MPFRNRANLPEGVPPSRTVADAPSAARPSAGLRIAALEDDEPPARLLIDWLGEAGHRCRWYSNGNDLERDLRRDPMDLLLLDCEVPEMSGEEVLLWARANLDWPVPIVFATNHDSEADVVHALSNGAAGVVEAPSWAAAGDATHGARQFEVRTKAGRELLVVATPASDPRRSGSSELVTITDITELRVADGQRDELLRFVSHDMRSPRISSTSRGRRRSRHRHSVQ